MSPDLDPRTSVGRNLYIETVRQHDSADPSHSPRHQRGTTAGSSDTGDRALRWTRPRHHCQSVDATDRRGSRIHVERDDLHRHGLHDLRIHPIDRRDRPSSGQAPMGADDHAADRHRRPASAVRRGRRRDAPHRRQWWFRVRRVRSGAVRDGSASSSRPRPSCSSARVLSTRSVGRCTRLPGSSRCSRCTARSSEGRGARSPRRHTAGGSTDG